MNTIEKRRILGAGLLMTLAATAWIASQDETKKPAGIERNIAGAGRGAQKPSNTRSEPVAELQLDKLKRADPVDEGGELFPSQTWQPPPAPPAPPAPPEPPRAPAMPFSYFGQLEEDGKAVVFLRRGDRDYAVRQGETIEGTYRIDEIRRDAMVMTYLPLQQQQTLAIGSVK
jgi:hypothetical protein